MATKDHEGSEFVERRINEWDRRRDVRLNEKIQAIEKYFDLALTTKAEALAIVIDRIQHDNKECSTRCANQIRIFYELINDLKEKNVEKQTLLDVLKTETVKLTNDIGKLNILLRHHKVDVDASTEAFKEEIESKIADQNAKIDSLVKWKDGSSLKIIATSVVVSVALINGFMFGFNWVIDYLSKITQIPGGP